MNGKFRALGPATAMLWQALLGTTTLIGVLYILGVQNYLGLALFEEQYIGLGLGLVLAAVFIGVPAFAGRHTDTVPWYDWLLAASGLTVGLYITVMFPRVILLLGYTSALRTVLATLAILLLLEAVRRLLGWVLVIIVAVFLIYALFGSHLPGTLSASAVNPTSLVNYIYLDPNSTLDMLGIAFTIALAFLLFGQILLVFGGGDMLSNVAFSLFGRYRGGPAKAAVVGSSLVGTITGGPVTNVMLTGTVTIPMMIKNGFSRVQAGAIEAVASTGGQLMPPVMGIAAFLIAEYLAVPYSEVVLAALVPAVLYYVCLFGQVDLLAVKGGLKGLSKTDVPSLTRSLREAWVVLPGLAVLVYFLFVLRYQPSTSAVIASLPAFLFLLVRREARRDLLAKVASVFVETGRLLLEIGVVLGAAGIIVGVVGITGLGFNLTLSLTELGSQNLLLLLVLSAILSIILGMGMPSVAAYALVAVLIAPAMVGLGVQPMAAHLFVFYFAVASNFTPPIALACFAAAPIARASPNRIGLEASRLGLVAYVVPFLFVYSPTLLLHGSILSVTLSVSTAVIGTFFLATSVTGHLSVVAPQKLYFWGRLLLGFGSLLLLFPVRSDPGIGLLVNALGALTLIGFLMAKRLQRDSDSMTKPSRIGVREAQSEDA